MSFYDLYVGDASDPKFHWEGGDYSGNIPAILVDLGGGIGPFGCARARNLLESEKYGGRVLDWGSSGARLTKQRIMEFLVDFQAAGHRPFYSDRVLSLEGDQEYILVACEQ